MESITKKILAGLLAAVMAMSFAACSENSDDDNDDDKSSKKISSSLNEAEDTVSEEEETTTTTTTEAETEAPEETTTTTEAGLQVRMSMMTLTLRQSLTLLYGSITICLTLTPLHLLRKIWGSISMQELRYPAIISMSMIL
ncbi:MAG: hypothetical protein IJ571_00995 [Ruminococcus sp.]|nr:hypothetical protein [Ruminococcus sp.]